MRKSFIKSRYSELLRRILVISFFIVVVLNIILNIYIVTVGQKTSAIITEVHLAQYLTVQFIDSDGITRTAKERFRLAGWIKNHWLRDTIEIYYLPHRPQTVRVNNVISLFVGPGALVLIFAGLTLYVFLYPKRKRS